MWSIYDTMILLTGLLTAAIAVIPVDGIRKKTRVTALVIGAALVVLSLYLGSLRSFTYPGVVFLAPVIPIIAAGAIVKAARDSERFRLAMSESAEPESQTDSASNSESGTDGSGEPDAARDAAWAALFDSATDAEELARIAHSHPEFAPQIMAHPNCYDELRAWAAAANGEI